MSNPLSHEQRREIQLSSLKALREIKRICEKNGLTYYITAGTLLGAIRHKGFIPWDDDIDIAMPRADYNEFARIARHELANGFFYQSEKTDRYSPFAFAKVRTDGTRVTEALLKDADIHSGCYVDIFPLDNCPISEKRAQRFFKLTTFFTCALTSKISNNFICGYERGAARAAFALARRLPWRVLTALRRAVRIYYTHFCRRGKLCTVSGSYGYPREMYNEEWFSHSISVMFEGECFPASAAYDAQLTSMYGDYMTPPPENERQGHFINNDKLKGENK